MQVVSPGSHFILKLRDDNIYLMFALNKEYPLKYIRFYNQTQESQFVETDLPILTLHLNLSKKLS